MPGILRTRLSGSLRPLRKVAAPLNCSPPHEVQFVGILPEDTTPPQLLARALSLTTMALTWNFCDGRKQRTFESQLGNPCASSLGKRSSGGNLDGRSHLFSVCSMRVRFPSPDPPRKMLSHIRIERQPLSESAPDDISNWAFVPLRVPLAIRDRLSAHRYKRPEKLSYGPPRSGPAKPAPPLRGTRQRPGGTRWGGSRRTRWPPGITTIRTRSIFAAPAHGEPP